MHMHHASRDAAWMDGGEVVERGALIRQDADQPRKADRNEGELALRPVHRHQAIAVNVAERGIVEVAGQQRPAGGTLAFLHQ